LYKKQGRNCILMKLDLVLCLATAAYAAPIPEVEMEPFVRAVAPLVANARKELGRIDIARRLREQQKLARFKKAEVLNAPLIAARLSKEAREVLNKDSASKHYVDKANRLLTENGWSEHKLLPAINALCKEAYISQRNPKTEAELVAALKEAERRSVYIREQLKDNYGQQELPQAFYRELLLSPNSEGYLAKLYLQKVDPHARGLPPVDGFETLKNEILEALNKGPAE
jgi:hypothetical protein